MVDVEYFTLRTYHKFGSTLAWHGLDAMLNDRRLKVHMSVPNDLTVLYEKPTSSVDVLGPNTHPT